MNDKPRKTKVSQTTQSKGEERRPEVPFEHYRGERTIPGSADQRGDIDEETLDSDAPFNKTYGRKTV